MVYISVQKETKTKTKTPTGLKHRVWCTKRKYCSVLMCDLCCKLHLYCEWEVFTSIIIAFIIALAECSAWGYFLKKTARWNKFENPNRGLLAWLMIFLRAVEYQSWKDTWSPKCFFCYREIRAREGEWPGHSHTAWDSKGPALPGLAGGTATRPCGLGSVFIS